MRSRAASPRLSDGSAGCAHSRRWRAPRRCCRTSERRTSGGTRGPSKGKPNPARVDQGVVSRLAGLSCRVCVGLFMVVRVCIIFGGLRFGPASAIPGQDVCLLCSLESLLPNYVRSSRLVRNPDVTLAAAGTRSTARPRLFCRLRCFSPLDCKDSHRKAIPYQGTRLCSR